MGPERLKRRFSFQEILLFSELFTSNNIDNRNTSKFKVFCPIVHIFFLTRTNFDEEVPVFVLVRKDESGCKADFEPESSSRGLEDFDNLSTFERLGNFAHYVAQTSGVKPEFEKMFRARVDDGNLFPATSQNDRERNKR